MKTIIIDDKVYGWQKINESVLIELIKSVPLQRLKKINQHGTQHITRPDLGKVNRFEHSVGVMILLRNFNAPLLEQIAGLLHDISHTAFSHVVDHAMGNTIADDFHEKFTSQVIQHSTIPKILKKYHLTFEQLEKTDNLLEKTEPNLCADRIDYFLRDNLVCYKFLNEQQAKKIVDGLKIFKNNWVFSDEKIALLMAKKFLQTARYGWYNPQNNGGFHILGKIIRSSLQKKLISTHDLFGDDETLFKKLCRIQDREIKKQILILKNLKTEINFNDYDYLSRLKFRAVDPLILQNGKIVRLSKIDGSFKKLFLDFKKYLQKGIPIKILN